MLEGYKGSFLINFHIGKVLSVDSSREGKRVNRCAGGGAEEGKAYFP